MQRILMALGSRLNVDTDTRDFRLELELVRGPRGGKTGEIELTLRNADADRWMRVRVTEEALDTALDSLRTLTKDVG